MPKVYINGISSISPQQEDILETGVPREFRGNRIRALDQDYKTLIKPMMLRRMSGAVKMGLFTAKKVLDEAKLKEPDAIIVGTGQGCLQDTEKFLEDMIAANEGLLSPTSFIQSTHNTVAGQIALDLNCRGYNMTYTQNSASFENALTDGFLQLITGEAGNILLGGVDEISEKITGFQEYDGQLKTEEILNTDLYSSATPGTIASEASAFFVLGTEKENSSYAEILDVKVSANCPKSKLKDRLINFLNANSLGFEDIDLIVSGRNGDNRYDVYYEEFEGAFPHALQIGYKHLVGENNTISAYALWLVCKIFRTKRIPDFLKLKTGRSTGEPGLALIYNQYLGKDHAFILIKAV